MTKEKENREKTRQKGYIKKSTVLIIILLLLLLFMGVILLLVMTKKTPDGVILDPSSGKYEAPIEVPENLEQEFISLPGLSEIYIKEGEDTAKVALWNPDTNPCYFKYSILLKETGEEIYVSNGLIAPGNAVTEVKFNRTFDVGVYPVIIRISTYDLADYEQQMNGGEVDAKLFVVEKE